MTKMDHEIVCRGVILKLIIRTNGFRCLVQKTAKPKLLNIWYSIGRATYFGSTITIEAFVWLTAETSNCPLS